MSSEKNTTVLLNELQKASSFGKYTESNEDAFILPGEEPEELSEYPNPHTNDAVGAPSVCPFCGASLLPGASYCTSCMQPLKPRTVITPKKTRLRRRGKLFLSGLIAAAVLLAVFSIIAAIFLFRKPSLSLPSAEEFRELLQGASDEEVLSVWAPEDLRLQGSAGGFYVYAAPSKLPNATVLSAFSEDGKCLYFAFSGFSEEDADKAAKLAENAFSAVYRYYPENLTEIMESDTAFHSIGSPEELGPRFAAFLASMGVAFPEGADLSGSLAIRTGKYQEAPKARILKVRSGESLSIFLLFESEGS